VWILLFLLGAGMTITSAQKIRELKWVKLADRVRDKLKSITYREGDDYELLGKELTSYFINVDVKNPEIFTVEFLRALRGCLIEESHNWGCIVSSRVNSETPELLATVFDLAIVEGDGGASINQIIANAQPNGDQ
jgi:hypothetical protein